MRAAGNAGEPGQRDHPLRDHGWMRRHAVVRQAIPRRKFEDFDVGREEAERARQRGHARAVTADNRNRNRRRICARCYGAGKIGDDQRFGAIGDADKVEEFAGLEPFGGGLAHRSSPALGPILSA